MQIILAFFLTFLVGCQGSRSECTEETQYCLAKLPDMGMDDSLKRASCRELINSIECMENAVNHRSCAGGEFEDILKDFIEEMKEAKKEKCFIVSRNNETQMCFEANQEYIEKCLFESTDEILDTLVENIEDEERPTENVIEGIKCLFFLRVATCSLKRIEEKCGIEAGREMTRKNNIIPVEFKNACEASGIVLRIGGLNGDRRKK